MKTYIWKMVSKGISIKQGQFHKYSGNDASNDISQDNYPVLPPQS